MKISTQKTARRGTSGLTKATGFGIALVAALLLSLLGTPAAEATATSTVILEPSGDPDGSGTAIFTVPSDPGDVQQYCFALTVDGIDTPTVAHIHQGAAGVDGPIVIDLMLPELGLSGCTPVEPQLMAVVDAIVADPAAYYVNVHTAEFPPGAIRGQLTAFVLDPVDTPMPEDPSIPEPTDEDAAAAALTNSFATASPAEEAATPPPADASPAAVPAAAPSTAAPATPDELAFTGSETSIAIAGLALLGAGFWYTALARTVRRRDS